MGVGERTQLRLTDGPLVRAAVAMGFPIIGRKHAKRCGGCKEIVKASEWMEHRCPL
jgi:hypothetical protein